jgi:NADPH-dependent 2,4-dienoyl-CoA reductase/sulfur reductase-like enzyme
MVRRVDDPASKTVWEAFDQALIATGAVPISLDVPNAGAQGILSVGTLQSGLEVRQAVDQLLDRSGSGQVVVVGGGYVGIEMAEACLNLDLAVSLIETQPQVMNTLDPDMGSLVSGALRQEGVRLYLDESLLGFEVSGDRVTSVVTDRRTIPADLVILGMGVRPNTTLAAEAGLSLGEKGAIPVSERMQTAVDGLWAAGDCAESFHLVSRRPTYVALGTVANKQGRVAGVNIGGGEAIFAGVVGTAITKFGSTEVSRTGLQESEARRLGLDCASARITGHTRPRYYPGSGEMTVKLLAERGSGRLLGGQIVGSEGAGKRIDVVATALHAEFTVDQIVDLDLSYAPPFSPVWDPVAIAARQLIKMV